MLLTDAPARSSACTDSGERLCVQYESTHARRAGGEEPFDAGKLDRNAEGP